MNDPMENAENLIGASDGLDQMIELVNGHRNKLVAAGFDEDVAQEMAAQLHAVFVDSIRDSVKEAMTLAARKQRLG